MRIITICLILFVTTSSFAQDFVDFKSGDWKLSEKTKLEEYKGKKCLHVDFQNSAINTDLKFQNGVVEFDMCVQEGRGFPGVLFHSDGESTMEEFYIRTHQSGNPDAMQYCPIYNGVAGWQLYHGNGYSNKMDYKYDQWFHVKLQVLKTQAEVYIEDMAKPVLVIHELKLGETGSGLSLRGPARFANLKVENTNNVTLKGKFKTVEKAGDEVITSYRVSKPFNLKDIINETVLSSSILDEKNFVLLETESDGLANLGAATKFSREKNTVIAQFDVFAKNKIIKELAIGFSDIAKVYVNGEATWMGQDVYRSRDYRFLGTAGYFDTIYLNLKKGKNTISIAVAENFGGWGVKAKFNDLDGITLK